MTTQPTTYQDFLNKKKHSIGNFGFEPNFYPDICFDFQKYTIDKAIRKGDFSASQTVFLDFLKRYPQSGYGPSALFWLANAQYATRDYKEAMVNFRALIARVPDHLRAPEAVLSIAKCQIELKDARGARRTLDDLIKAYPQSEAAVAAKERLSRLKS